MFAATLMLVAAEDAPPLIDLDGTVFVQFGLFLVLFIVLSQILWKPFLKLRDERQAGMGGAREQAEEMGAKSRELTDRYDRKVAETKAKATDERNKLRVEAANREREILEAARQKAQAAQGAARKKIAEQSEAAKGKLEVEAAALAKTVAGRVLGREVA
jgi:F-type H+-transporting ATPase subunit b